MSIYDLIRRILEGDAEATKVFVEEYEPRLSARAKRRYYYLEVEDLVQDAFVYYLQKDAATLGRFLEKSGRLGPTRLEQRDEPSDQLTEEEAESEADCDLERFLWDALCGIAANRRRTWDRDPTIPVDPSTQLNEADQRATPDTQAIDRDSANHLLQCLAEKNPKFVLILRMEHEAGFSTEETARALNVKTRKVYDLRQAIRRRARWCRKKLGL